MMDERTTKTATRTGSKTGRGTMDLSDLLEHALRDMHYAEKKIYKSLPKMIRAAQDAALKDALSTHRDEISEQIEMLDDVFAALGKPVKSQKCDAIDGIIEESEGLLEDFKGSAAIDATIIYSAQAVEHYEITRYGSMHEYAKVLGSTEAANLLGRILQQEKAADKKLTAIAERCNLAAAA